MKLGFLCRSKSTFALFFLCTQCGTLAAVEDHSHAIVFDDPDSVETGAVDTDLYGTSITDHDSPPTESDPAGRNDSAHSDGGVAMELLPPTEDMQQLAAERSITSIPLVELDGPVVIVDDYSETELTIEQECEPSEDTVTFGDWLGYNSAQSSTTWLAGDQMGMFSLESFPSLDLGSDSALVVGTGFHFLNGPKKTDMPPRLFDFIVGYHARRAISDDDFVDAKFSVGAFSDFEGSARKGIRYPGHAVSYHRWHPNFISVLGVEVLDRDDIAALPVGGVVVRCADDLLFELVFPRPRIQLRVSDKTAMYVAGELGGGTWAIERIDRRNDNATYRDLRITFGVTDFGEASEGVLEFGLAFDRSLEYRSTVGDTDLDSTFLLRCHVHY